MMTRITTRAAVGLAVAALIGGAATARAQAGGAASAPDVGAMAPDFTLHGATRFGLLKDPVKLSDYRGQTVVLNFFPKARTKGWTIQMEAYRDQYATLFNSGKKVVVIGISVDADTVLGDWAKDSGFPNLFASDPDQTVAKAYGSADAKYDTRNVFIIGPDGHIAHRIMKLNVLSQDAYAEIAAEVAKTLKASGGSN
jgi:thioredoxin-dependent peroxiredoxin